MITNNLDVLNSVASKPTLGNKADLSALANGQGDTSFQQELANVQQMLGDLQPVVQKEQESALAQNISLSAENLPSLSSPNKVSEGDVKNFIENLNNFSNLQLAEKALEEESSEELVVAGVDGLPQIGQPNLTLVNPQLEAKSEQQLGVQSPVAKPVVATPFKMMKNLNFLPQEVSVVPNKPVMEKALPAGNDGSQGLDLQGFDFVKPQTVSRDVVKTSPEMQAKAALESLMPKSVAEAVQNQQQPSFEAATILPQDVKVVEAKKQVQVPVQENFDKSILEALSQFHAKAAMPEAKAEQVKTVQNQEALINSPVLGFVSNPMNFAAPVASGNLKQENSSKEFGAKDMFIAKDISAAEGEKSVDMPVDNTFTHLASKDKLADNTQKTAVIQTPVAPTDAQHKANVDQLISQARTIVSSGGGEMKLRMSPEGMGTVDLHVGVKNGVVNIAINTENEKIKKMFDESIMDIRSALENHSLKIESLKVNVSEQLDKQLSQNNQQNFNMSNKDFARNFMHQFRDERQGFRNQSLSYGMDKFRPSLSKEPAGLNPAARVSASSSGRLNIVA